jgi:hypothetical protein
VEELRRISKAHSGYELTPGVLCYFYDELLKYQAANPSLFEQGFDQKLKELWALTARGFARFGAGPDGFPLPSNETP